MLQINQLINNLQHTIDWQPMAPGYKKRFIKILEEVRNAAENAIKLYRQDATLDFTELPKYAGQPDHFYFRRQYQAEKFINAIHDRMKVEMSGAPDNNRPLTANWYLDASREGEKIADAVLGPRKT